MPATDSPRHVFIGLARVLDYNPATAVVRILVRGHNHPIDTQLCSPLLTFGREGDIITGAGINCAPEAGSLALALRDSHGEWYTMSFVSLMDGAGGKFKALRKERNQGDISLSTRFGNAVEVLAGGLTNVRATSLTGTAYIPDSELIHNNCRNFIVDTFAGNFNWLFNQKSKKGSAVFKVNSTDDTNSPQAILSMGHNRSGNLYEATVSTAPKSRFAINKQGMTRVESAKDVNVLAESGNIRINGRMIYLNSGPSGASAPSEFPDNATQVDPITPSLPTPDSLFPAYIVIPVTLSSADIKRLLNPSTFVEETEPLDPVG